MFYRSGSITLAALLCLPTCLYAQWFELQDPETGIECGLINAENVRLVIADPGSSLILVNGADRELVNTFVNDLAEVFIEGEPVGFLEFARDADDRRRVFWVTDIGSLYRLETNGEPMETEIFPEEVAGDCDPCLFWDNEADCVITPFDDSSDGNGTGLLAGLCGLGAGGSALASVTLGLVTFRGRRCLRRWRR